MTFKLSNHVKEEMVRPSISWSLLEQVLNNPQQIVIEKGNLKAYQSIVSFDDTGIHLTQPTTTGSVWANDRRLSENHFGS